MTPRETGAAAIWAAEHDEPCEWPMVSHADQEMYLRLFDAAVAAYTHLAAEQGWRMVPEKATPELKSAGVAWCGNPTTYEAAIESAPKFEVVE